MLQVETLTLGQLQTNCYLLWNDETKETWIIDPADDGDFISQRILELQLQPTKIILTHGHFDHVLGLLPLKLNFNLPILMHQSDMTLLKKAQNSALHWLNIKTDPIPQPDIFLNDSDELSFKIKKTEEGLREVTFKILHTPGHTPGSICLVGSEMVFSGDTLFKGTIGRTDFSYSNHQDMIESLEKLAKLDPKLKVYAGHGEPTTIGQEKNQISKF